MFRRSQEATEIAGKAHGEKILVNGKNSLRRHFFSHFFDHKDLTNSHENLVLVSNENGIRDLHEFIQWQKTQTKFPSVTLKQTWRSQSVNNNRKVKQDSRLVPEFFSPDCNVLWSMCFALSI